MDFHNRICHGHYYAVRVLTLNISKMIQRGRRKKLAEHGNTLNTEAVFSLTLKTDSIRYSKLSK